MSTEEIGKAFIDHHGVKGQRWGVRRAQSHTQGGIEKAVNRQLRTAGQTHREKKATRKDKKWQKNIYKTKSAIAIHNNVADKMNNGGLDSLNNSVRFAKMNKRSNPELTKAYYKAYEQMNERFTRQAVQEIHGTSPSGRLKATLNTSSDQWFVEVSSTDVQHSVAMEPIITDVDHDDNGFVTLHMNVREPLVQDSIKMGEAFIEHHGVKGMKWGVRGAKFGAKALINRRKARKAAEHPMSEDAQRHAAAKKKKLHELNDKELKDLANRLNMEQQVKRMNPASIKKGHNAAKAVIAVSGTITALSALAGSPAGKAIKNLVTNAVKVDVSSIGKTKPPFA